MEAAVVLVEVQVPVGGVTSRTELVPLHWHVPAGRTGGSLPDSRGLWEVIWANRERIAGIAHSHPGSGTWPSDTDYSTFKAIEDGLGRRLSWWIVAKAEVSLTRWREDPREDGRGEYGTAVWHGAEGWPEYLREISNY